MKCKLTTIILNFLPKYFPPPCENSKKKKIKFLAGEYYAGHKGIHFRFHRHLK